MKKLSAILMVSLTLSVFTSCGSGSNESEAARQDSLRQVAIQDSINKVRQDSIDKVRQDSIVAVQSVVGEKIQKLVEANQTYTAAKKKLDKMDAELNSFGGSIGFGPAAQEYSNKYERVKKAVNNALSIKKALVKELSDQYDIMTDEQKALFDNNK